LNSENICLFLIFQIASHPSPSKLLNEPFFVDFMQTGYLKESLLLKVIGYFFIIFLGTGYVIYEYQAEAKQQRNIVMQLAQTIEINLPLGELENLHDNPDSIKKLSFPKLKSALQNVIKVTPKARFAYLYVQIDEKLYFLVDSEPENSPDYSPSGQEFTEAALIDKKPFETKKAQLTEPVTDRWGTWVSAEVPIINPANGNVVAVLGMDYNADEWKKNVLFHGFQSVIFVLFVFFLVGLIKMREKKNRQLKEEIDQRIKTEINLLESQMTLANLVSNLPGLVYRCSFDRDYTMEFISEACNRITGYSPHDFTTGKRVAFNDIILPEYREPIWTKWQTVLKEGLVFEEEYPIITASGEIKWVWERGKCVYDEHDNLLYLEGYIEDISARKKAERELKKMSLAIEQNPVSVVITSFNGLIEYVNPRFTEMTGYEMSEVLGENPRILKSGKMAPEFYTDMWQTITSGKIWRGEIVNRKKSGDFLWVSKSISPIIDERGKITNFVAIAEDISERKQIEAELILAKEKAEESDRLKSAFLANISHEIRTPMNGIMGFAELLKEPNLPTEAQMEYLDIIEKSGQRMLNIINDLIDISKIEAGQMSFRIKKTNVNKILHDLHLFFIPEIDSKDVHFDFHCGLAEEDAIIETDTTKLNQILTNLIKNAVKFTDQGSINFGYRKKGEMLEFYVEDTGPGIPEDQKELIFERFRQSTINNLTRKFEGAGLGLAISKAYVEMLGGSIWLVSKSGTGSTFYFELPYKKASSI
jgi:PAS domain S-box